MKTVLDILIEEDRSSAIPSDEITRSIAGWVSKVQQLDDETQRTEEQLKQLKFQRKEIVTNRLPMVLQDANIERMDVSGVSLTLRHIVAPNLAKADHEKFHRWLVDNGHGDLIKRRIVVEFGRGDTEDFEATARWLNDHAVNYSVSEGVHPQTLGAWVRTMAEDGQPLPDVLNIYEGEEVVIKSR